MNVEQTQMPELSVRVPLALFAAGLRRDCGVPVPDPMGLPSWGQSGTNGHKTFSFPDRWPGQVTFT